MTVRVLTFLLLIPTVVLSAGCSKSDKDQVAVHPVKGQVLYEGKPVAGVEITLIPTDAPTVPKIPRNPRAVTGSDGRFTIGTFADADGAAEGGYQIVCHWPKTAPGAEGEEEMETAGNDRLLGWYDGVHSKFSVRVQAGSNDIPVLQLQKHTQPPPVSEGVPGRN
jgi:hypothetical protein